MVEENIKNISSFSKDGIKQAVERILSKDEKQQLMTISSKLADILGTPSKDVAKRNVKMRLNLSSKEVFARNILPKIREKLSEYEQRLLRNDTDQWNINFDFQTDFSRFTLPELQTVHAQIVKQEENVQNLDLVIKFYGGMVYISAYQSAQLEPDIAEWFQSQLGVNYNTAMCYIAHALMIRRYPRLIVCGLTFWQIVKHKDNIDKFLETESEGMKERLEPLSEITAQGKRMKIESGEVCIPCLLFSIDPDAEYLNQIADVQLSNMV